MDHGSYFYPQLILGWEYTKTYLVLWVNGKRMKLYASDISVNHVVTYFPAQLSKLSHPKIQNSEQSYSSSDLTSVLSALDDDGDVPDQ